MLGLAVGVATLLISIALLSGFQVQIKSRLIESSPQLLVEPAGQNTIARADEIVAAARQLGMTDIRPFISGIGWASTSDQQRQQPVRIRSYVRGHEPPGDAASRSVVLPPMDESQIFLARGIAVSLGIDIGDRITVIAPRMRLTPFGQVPVWKRYRVTRLVLPGDDENRVDAWLEHSEAAALFGTSGAPTAIEMYGQAERAEEIQSALAGRFTNAQFKTWKEINRPLFLALRLEKVVMFATISLIIFVAALNLVSSLSMLILEKRPSVGVLRTLGATERNILSLFMQVGLLIGLTGTLLGNVIGVGFSWLANRYQLVPLPPAMYAMSYLPFELDPKDLIWVNVIAVGLSVVATWYPARIASRLDPIVAIREE